MNVDQLFSTIDLIEQNPEVAKFKFRATNKWINGTHCQATVKDFFGALKKDTSRQAVVFHMDGPPVLLGNNQGTNPVEYLLVSAIRVHYHHHRCERFCQRHQNQKH